jgi:FtsH-binding integral membrane protein
MILLRFIGCVSGYFLFVIGIVFTQLFVLGHRAGAADVDTTLAMIVGAVVTVAGFVLCTFCARAIRESRRGFGYYAAWVLVRGACRGLHFSC